MVIVAVNEKIHQTAGELSFKADFGALMAHASNRDRVSISPKNESANPEFNRLRHRLENIFVVGIRK